MGKGGAGGAVVMEVWVSGGLQSIHGRFTYYNDETKKIKHNFGLYGHKLEWPTILFRYPEVKTRNTCHKKYYIFLVTLSSKTTTKKSLMVWKTTNLQTHYFSFDTFINLIKIYTVGQDVPEKRIE